jgi:hypothetical protein
MPRRAGPASLILRAIGFAVASSVGLTWAGELVGPASVLPLATLAVFVQTLVLAGLPEGETHPFAVAVTRATAFTLLALLGLGLIAFGTCLCANVPAVAAAALGRFVPALVFSGICAALVLVFVREP